MGIRFVRRIASYNALFDTEKSVIEGKIALFWDENCFKLMGWLGPTPIQHSKSSDRHGEFRINSTGFSTRFKKTKPHFLHL
jgi:hypothetical protein